MYQCKIEPILGHDSKIVLEKSKSFLRAWIENAPKTAKGRSFIQVTWFKSRQEIYLDYLASHLDNKGLNDQIRRYRLIPCVRELLEKSKENPISMDSTDKHNKWNLVGLTPRGVSFYVIISQFRGGKLSGERFLNTFYPTKK